MQRFYVFLYVISNYHLKEKILYLFIKEKLPVLLFIGCTLLFAACNTTKYLESDEYLLNKIDTKLDKDADIKKPSNLKGELVQFYKQEPNTNFLFVPREWYYYKNQDPGDTTWIKKWSKNSLGEKPTILDTNRIRTTTVEMQNYLRNKKGYYQATVYDTIIYKNKKAEVLYFVDPKQRYVINSLEYFTLDSVINKKIKSLEEGSLLKVGDPVDALSFNVEKQRIVTALQNSGYANFSLNYVSIKGDSTGLDHSWDIYYEILPPSDSTVHKKYRVGDIEVYTDFNQFQNNKTLKKEEIYDKLYFRESEDFLVKPSIIDNKIFLKKYDVFNTKTYEKTVQKLFNLDAYRFIKLASNINPEQDSLIDYKILMTPQVYRWAFDIGNDFFYSNRSRAPQNLVGFSIGGSLENRNTFGGSETFKISAETGFEFVVLSSESNSGNDGFINTFSLGINNTLEFPKFTNGFNLMKFGNKLGLIKDHTISKMDEEATSRLSLGYNLIDILQDYKIFTVSTSYGYDIRINNRSRISFNQTGFDYAEYDIRENYEPIIQNNNVLAKSFQNTLFTGLLFKDMSYYYQTDHPISLSNWAFILNLEFSGLEIHALNGLYNSIANSSSTWALKNGVDFEKMVKLELDGRWYKNLTKNSQLAARFKTGVSLPYGTDGNGDPNVVSFIKQFLVGGPNSIRAWRPMALGPGNYILSDPDDSQNYFQRGDLLMEFNLEYRFDLFWLMEAGLFLDGGNVWTLKEDADRPGSKISSDFLNQIALGYGWGVRFDFTYFLIRFDFGYKLRSPYRDPTTNSFLVPLKGQGLFGNFNVAVNYPF